MFEALVPRNHVHGIDSSTLVSGAAGSQPRPPAGPVSVELAGTASVPAFLDCSFNTYRQTKCVASRECGHWRWLATEELQAEIRRLTLALLQLGSGPGSHIALIGEPSPHWLAADVAIQTVGAVSVPLFPTMSGEHFRHAINHTGTRTVIVLGQAGWNLVEANLHVFRTVIVRGVAVTSKGRLHAWHDTLALGDGLSASDPGLFTRLLARVRSDDLATIIHTSGSTGLPKGVELTHANLVSQIRVAAGLFPLQAGRDRALSCLPFAHVFERVVVYTYLVQGAPVLIADDVKQVGALLREVQPAVMTAVPRLIEKIHLRIRTQIADSIAIKRQLGRWALELAVTRAPTMREKRGAHPWALRVADRLIYAKLRQALGGRLQYLIVGGAALSDELTRFLIGVDLPVYTGYGLTEASPVIAVNHPGARRLGTVGKAFPGVEIRLGDAARGEIAGEILARGPGIMRGYHREAVSPVDAAGWLHTGDVGTLDADGYLTITGRVKELFKTANGKYVAPNPIEQALTSAEGNCAGLVDQALVVAEGQPCVAALLFPDPDSVRRRKVAAGCAQLPDADFLARPEIVAELAGHICAINGHLSQWERIRCWRLVAEPPSIANEGLTPTMKLRRHALTRRYERLISDMYAHRPAVDQGGDHG